MKKLLLAGLSALTLFTSCSDDDANTSEGTQLKKISVKHFHNDTPGPQLAQTDVAEYSNGLLIKKSYYGPDGSLNSYQVFGYEQDMLTSVITYTAYSGEELLYSTENYTYDDAGRIINYSYLEDNGQPQFTYDYIFNSDNTISVMNDGNFMKTYHMNGDGIIYKEVHGDQIYELTFDGNNVVAADSPYQQLSKTFEYDTTHDKSLLGLESPTGSVKANWILSSDQLGSAETRGADKYLTKIVRNGGNPIDYVYTFNGSGRPVKKTMHLNGDMETIWEEHTYYYE